jgi:hypothetical protein
MESKRLRKSGGCGSVLARSSGAGSVGGAAKDRLNLRLPAQTQGILYAEPREVLDGEVTSRLGGFHAETAATDCRELYVPYHITKCDAEALLICREHGLLKSKLESMTPEAEAYAYYTTIAQRELEN